MPALIILRTLICLVRLPRLAILLLAFAGGLACLPVQAQAELAGIGKIVNASSTILEEFNASTTTGSAHGLSYEASPYGTAARFSRTAESRVQFPFSSGLPTSGTIEMLVKIDSAYYYLGYNLNTNNDCALLFTTDVRGADVTWPGSAWFSVCKNGDISLIIATTKYGSSPPQVLSATGTAFRFGEWHSVGFSYGSAGQALMVDGVQVGNASANTVLLGSGGNHSSPIDVPTLGESVPGYWANNQYDGGFEGLVDTFRASTAARDWTLVPKSGAPTVILEDDFNDSVLNTAIWQTRGQTVTEHDGYADLRADATDNVGFLWADFAPQNKVRLEVRHMMHGNSANGWYFDPGITLVSVAANATDDPGRIDVTWRKNSWDVNNCTNQFDKVFLANNGFPCLIFSSASSSSFYDKWITSVIEYDVTTGQVTVDLDNDGIVDLQAVIPVANRYPIKGIWFGPYGWWTGHWHRLDYVRLTTGSSTPISQTITLGTTPTVTVGGTGTVSAMASSALPVTFTSLTVSICTVSGSTVTGVAAGTCTLAANQAGNANYSPAAQATQSFNVVAPTTYTYSLTVNSSGATGVAIAASPTTYSGRSNYSKTGIAAGTSLTLTALPTMGSAMFSQWSGCDVASGVTCALTLNASRSVTAVYNTNTSLLSQSITFGAVPNIIVGGTGTVIAKASSGLEVTFTSANYLVCSVVKSGVSELGVHATVTGIGPGTCTITANQAGNATYSPAAQVTQSFSIATGDYTQTLEKIYIAYFGRPADPSGLNYWNDELVTGKGSDSTLQNIFTSFSISAEYIALHAGQTTEQLVESLYLYLYGRTTDAEGLSYWVQQIQSGANTLDRVAYIIATAANNDQDRLVLNNKVLAATTFTAHIDTPAEITGYKGTPAHQSARAFMATVKATVPDNTVIDAAVQAATATPQSATPPSITLVTLPSGKVGVPYFFAFTATGSAPITFSASALPLGLSMSESGVISGTPVGAVRTGGTVTASNGTPPNDTQSYMIVIEDTAAVTCTTTLSPTRLSVNASGSTGSIAVTTSSGCGWTAASNVDWITVTSGASGSGNGSVGYSVADNPLTTVRGGMVTIGGVTFSVTQEAATTCTTKAC